MRRSLRELYQEIGLEDRPNESLTQKELRQDVIIWMCTLDDVDCLAQTNAVLTKSISSKLQIHPNVRQAIYCMGNRKGTTKHEQYFLQLLRTTGMEREQERQIVAAALGCTANKKLMKNLITYALSNSSDIFLTESERATALISGLVTNQNLIIRLVLEQLDTVYVRLGSKQFVRLVTTMVDFVSTDKQFDGVTKRCVRLW